MLYGEDLKGPEDRGQRETVGDVNPIWGDLLTLRLPYLSVHAKIGSAQPRGPLEALRTISSNWLCAEQILSCPARN